MSDYLWDRTGEADAEVERLEALLGAFGHTPRPLEMPADVSPHVSHRPRLFDARRLFVPVRLFGSAGLAAAAAAVLLLAFLLGGAALLGTRMMNDGGRQVASGDTHMSHDSQAEPPRYSSHERQESAATRKATESREQMDANAQAAKSVEKFAIQDFKTTRPQGEQFAALSKQSRKPAPRIARVEARGVVETMSAASSSGGVAASLFDSTRLMAKEQLVYALRLTGAKLEEVRRKTKGLDDAKPAPVVRQPIR
jgi:hypothetical protein